MFVGTFVIEPADPGGWLVLVGLALCLHSPWVTIRERRECFVVTNMRVFRLHGVLSTHRATMPLSRILDITVDKPARRPDPRLRPPHLRVRRPGPGAARDPVRRPAPTSAT